MVGGAVIGQLSRAPQRTEDSGDGGTAVVASGGIRDKDELLQVPTDARDLAGISTGLAGSRCRVGGNS
jgi:hypothetical protein